MTLPLLLDWPDPPPPAGTCRKCKRPGNLHCPGCWTCWPDHTCEPWCEADIDETADMAARIDYWEAWTGPGDPLYPHPDERCDDSWQRLTNVIGERDDPCIGAKGWHHEHGEVFDVVVVSLPAVMRWQLGMPVLRFGRSA